MNDKKKAQNLLIKIFRTSLLISILFGFFPLSIKESTGHFSFSWKGYPVLALILRLALGIMSATFHYKYLDWYVERFGRQSDTGKLTDELAAFVILFGEVILGLLLIWNRHSVFQFQEQLLAKLYRLLEDKQDDHKRLLKIHSEIKRLCGFILTGFLFQGIYYLWHYFRETKSRTDSFAYYLDFLCAAFWASTTFLRLVSRVWLLSIVKCLTVALMSINDLLRCLQENYVGVLAHQLELAMEGYQEIEALVQQYNLSLGIFQAIALPMLAVTLVGNIFEAIIYFKKSSFIFGIQYFVLAFLNFAILHCLALAATEVENEAKEYIILLQEVTLRKINGLPAESEMRRRIEMKVSE